MPTFYGPPSDGTVIPEQLETALAADLGDPASSLRGALDGADLARSKNAALAPWHAAVANRDYAPARWLPIGDSITEGGVVSAPERRWINRATAQLRQRFQTEGLGAGGGFGYRPSFYAVPAQYMGNSEDAATGTNQTATASFGLGGRTAQMSAGATRAYSFVGTSFQVFYAGGPATGDFTVTIDGGAPVTVDTTKAAVSGGFTWSSPALTTGAHNVVLTVLAGGDVYLEGLVFYNGDESKGIQQFDAAHWGYQSSKFVPSDTSRWAESVPAIQPHLVTIAAMTNDYSGGIAPTTTRTNYESVIAKVRQIVTNDPSFVLIVWPTRQDVATPVYPWSDYVDMCHALAADDPGVTVLDLSETMPGPGSVHGLWATDKVHLSNKGAAFIADKLVEFLTP